MFTDEQKKNYYPGQKISKSTFYRRNYYSADDPAFQPNAVFL
jgi:hypothetical protein